MNDQQSAGNEADPKSSGRCSPARTFTEVRCVLGEGPAWDASSQLLYWVDIRARKIYAATTDGEVRHCWRSLAPPSAVIPALSGALLVTAGQEILELCQETGKMTPHLHLSGEPMGNRCNDAKCDPLGNLWIGTMDDAEKERTGRLWRFDPDGDGEVFLNDLGVANTLAWDTARGRFYFTDSTVGDIYAFDYDSKSAAISNRKTFFSRSDAPGVPDGSAIDEDGYLWNARWDGGCVIRIAPDGALDRVIELPAQRPTSCAFGGREMKTLYVTSAALDSPAPADRADVDGSVLSFDVDVPGSRIPLCNRMAG